MMDTSEDSPPRAEPEYPKVLLDKVRAVSQIPAIQGEVLIAIHETREPYGDNIYAILGVYSTLNSANKIALELFKREYAHFFGHDGDMSHWLQRKPRVSRFSEEWELEERGRGDQRDNTVVWEIRNGAVSLRAVDGGNGDFYQVYVKRCRVE